MAYYLQKPVAYDQLATVSHLRALLKPLQRPELIENWEAVKRAAIAAVPATLEKLKTEIESVRPGAVELIQSAAERLRAATRVVPEMRDALALVPRSLGLDFLYLHTSQVVYGRENGIAASKLLPYGYHGFLSQSFEFPFPCPACGAQGLVSSRQPFEKDPQHAHFDYACPTCKHEQEHAYGDSPWAAIACSCASCKSLVDRVARETQPWAATLLTRMCAELRDMIRNEQRALAAIEANGLNASPVVGEVSSLARRFVNLAREAPELDLVDLMIRLDRRRGIARFEDMSAHYEHCCNLTREGVLSVSVDTIPHADDQALLQEFLTTLIHAYDHGDPEEISKVSQGITGLLKGFPEGDIRRFKEWVAFLDASRLPYSWSQIPLECKFEINLGAVRRLSGIGDAPPILDAKQPVAYRYEMAKLPSFEPLDGLTIAIGDLLRPALLTQAVQIQGVLQASSTETFAEKAIKDFLETHPLAAPKLAALAQLCRERKLDAEAVQTLGQLSYPEKCAVLQWFYWTLSRDAVGDRGVPSAWFLNAFGTQISTLRKMIESPRLKWTCPCCSAEGDLSDIEISKAGQHYGSEVPSWLVRAEHQSNVSRFAFQCSACGHSEAFSLSPKDAPPNAVSCACTACSRRREAVRAAVHVAGATLLPQFIENIKTQFKPFMETGEPVDGGNESWDYEANSQRAIQVLATALAQGPLAESRANAAFANTWLAGRTSFRYSPAWVMLAAKHSLITLGTPAVLSDELQFFFYWQEINHSVRLATEDRLHLEHIEALLKNPSEADLALLYEGISEFRRCRIYIPRRTPAYPNAKEIMRAVHKGTWNDLDLGAIQREIDRPTDKKSVAVERLRLQGPSWPTRRTGDSRATEV
jgi:hypothetical protein